jgi:hypothetical protein
MFSSHSDGRISKLRDFDINYRLLIFGLYYVCKTLKRHSIVLELSLIFLLGTCTNPA